MNDNGYIQREVLITIDKHDGESDEEAKERLTNILVDLICHSDEYPSMDFTYID